MRVLIGCERSGKIRRAFKAGGHEAYSVDLESSEDGADGRAGILKNAGCHFVGDVFRILSSWPYLFDPLAPWDLFIVHPECRFTCGSGLHWNRRRLGRESLTDAAVEFAVRCWQEGKKHAKRVVMEQPIGRMGPVMLARFGLRPQIVQPYQFGDDASKATCLFLHGVKPLRPTKFVEPRMVCGKCKKIFSYDLAGSSCPHCGVESSLAKPRWSNQTDSGQNRLGPSPTRAMDRARTYPGIADAMAQQWGEA